MAPGPEPGASQVTDESKGFAPYRIQQFAPGESVIANMISES
jgi:hypothetical protein